jgi:hypothetical protein
MQAMDARLQVAFDTRLDVVLRSAREAMIVEHEIDPHNDYARPCVRHCCCKCTTGCQRPLQVGRMQGGVVPCKGVGQKKSIRYYSIGYPYL